jgi:hypothetical protein
LDVVRITIWERTEPYLKLALHLIPLINPGSGDLMCLDLGRMSNGECPVVYRSHETGEVDQELAPDFGTFLADRVRVVLENP